MIPYGKQDISQQDIDAVVAVLKSDFLTQGPVVPAFEASVASFCRAEYAVAMNSATSALHLACLSLGVGKGDLVWTSPVTFVASSNCALYCGADVDFVDIDPRTYNMSVSSLSEKLEQSERDGCLPKVVIPVHLCGQPCEMAEIRRLADQYGFSIIEDAAHAIGGRYQSAAIGSCEYSDITVFSFHPVKIVTTGEGGMAVTNNSQLAQQMELLRSHGITRDEKLLTEASHGGWYYQQQALGFNYRITDIQAALGVSQVTRLEEFVSRRHELARYYDQQLSDVGVTVPWQHPDSYSGLHLYVIRLDESVSREDHRRVFDGLREAGVGVNLHYMPVYLQPYYAQLGFSEGYCPEAERYYHSAISLPMFPTLTHDQQDEVVSVLKSLVQ
jgi:UDP-4-amino-4,6-dideoxy-N-acetyl-beta-L-altrosamine transaminase